MLRLDRWPAAGTREPVPRRNDRRRRGHGDDRDARGRGPGRAPGQVGHDMTERAGRPAWTRRRVLALGVVPAAVLAAGGGAERASRGALPDRSILERLDGACSVAGPRLEYSSPEPSFSGTFYSAARRQPVGYTIAYPPGHRRGDELPLVVMLHGYGGSHA